MTTGGMNFIFIECLLLLQFLGQYMMTITPKRQIIPPIRSYLSGIILPIFQPQRMERTTNTPPYAAYALPKFWG
jgi:hypothetical protein